MKHFIIILIIFLFNYSLYAQVSIGKKNTENSNISLEFYDESDNVKGILLPWVSTIKDVPVEYNSVTKAGYRGMQGEIVNGTIVLDLSDKKVKYMKEGDWFDLTGEPPFPLSFNGTNLTKFDDIDSSFQDNKREYEESKIAIGKKSDEDTTNGILVLTDDNYAMVLPKVIKPHLQIVDPSPGMMVYDPSTKMLAVYNGTVWSFWKA